MKCALFGTAACSFMHVKCQHEKLELVEFMPMKLLIENGEKKWNNGVTVSINFSNTYKAHNTNTQKNNHLTSAADAITKSQCSS